MANGKKNWTSPGKEKRREAKVDYRGHVVIFADCRKRVRRQRKQRDWARKIKKPLVVFVFSFKLAIFLLCSSPTKLRRNGPKLKQTLPKKYSVASSWSSTFCDVTRYLVVEFKIFSATFNAMFSLRILYKLQKRLPGVIDTFIINRQSSNCHPRKLSPTLAHAFVQTGFEGIIRAVNSPG